MPSISDIAHEIRKQPPRDWLLRKFVDNLLKQYPLPWSIERDWTVEVLDARRRVVFKCITVKQAETLIEIAEDVEKENVQADADMKELLDETGEDADE